MPEKEPRKQESKERKPRKRKLEKPMPESDVDAVDKKIQEMKKEDDRYIKEEIIKAKVELENIFDEEGRKSSEVKESVEKGILEALERAMGKETELTVVQGGETITGVVIPEYIDGDCLCLTTQDGIGMFVKISEIKKVEVQK